MHLSHTRLYSLALSLKDPPRPSLLTLLLSLTLPPSQPPLNAVHLKSQVQSVFPLSLSPPALLLMFDNIESFLPFMHPFQGNKSFIAFSNLGDADALTKTWKVCPIFSPFPTPFINTPSSP